MLLLLVLCAVVFRFFGGAPLGLRCNGFEGAIVTGTKVVVLEGRGAPTYEIASREANISGAPPVGLLNGFCGAATKVGGLSNVIG